MFAFVFMLGLCHGCGLIGLWHVQFLPWCDCRGVVVCLLCIREERDEEEEREKDRDDDAVYDEYFIMIFILFYCVES